ncbi:MAG: ZIP family metal transporter [Nitrososphaerales archaeon]|nr:ZIP family metal transporter [Nitrososphaerales archaeon]
MFDLLELFVLGAVAGFTIFFGLPIALLGASQRLKGFLNAFATGILVFLIVDVFSHAWTSTTGAVISAFGGSGPGQAAAWDVLAMFGGLAVGLLSLVAYERRYLGKVDQLDVAQGPKLATMIALGIGAHNLSEGLAIGQSYASGAIGLAIVLVVGFGAHNTTEGFGITAPLAGLNPRPKMSFLVKIMLIGGGPTFVGTVLGSLFYSPVAYILFLSLAGGALVYVTMALYGTGRRRSSNELMMAGVFLGLCAGFLTDLLVSLGGA